MGRLTPLGPRPRPSLRLCLLDLFSRQEIFRASTFLSSDLHRDPALAPTVQPLRRLTGNQPAPPRRGASLTSSVFFEQSDYWLMATVHWRRDGKLVDFLLDRVIKRRYVAAMCPSLLVMLLHEGQGCRSFYQREIDRGIKETVREPK